MERMVKIFIVQDALHEENLQSWYALKYWYANFTF